MMGTRKQISRAMLNAVDALAHAADLLDTIELPFADDIALRDELREHCATLLSRLASREKENLS